LKDILVVFLTLTPFLYGQPTINRRKSTTPTCNRKEGRIIFFTSVLKRGAESSGLQHSDSNFPDKETGEENYLHMHC